MLDLLCNLLLLVFWVRFWSSDRLSLYYNPYIAGLNRASRLVLDRMRAVFPQWPQKLSATVVFGLLLLLRIPLLTYANPDRLTLSFGLVKYVAFGGWLRLLVFSLSSFALFLFYLSLAYCVMVKAGRNNGCWGQCLAFVMRPLPSLKPSHRLIAITVLGFAVMVALELFAVSLQPGSAMVQKTTGLGFTWRVVVNTLAAAFGWLPAWQSLLMAMIIGSWIGMLSLSDSLAGFCREGIEFLLVPFGNFRLTVGMLDLTPLLAVLALQAVYQLALFVLLPFYSMAL